MGKNKAKPQWTDEQFIKAWESANTIEEVINTLNAPNRQSVSLKAAAFRKHGIPLKNIVKSPIAKKPKVDVDAALKILSNIRKTTIAKLKDEGKKIVDEIEKRKKEKKANA